MLASSRNANHRQHELEEIVADLPHTTSVLRGPASISQHPTCKIHCSNPDDFSRVSSLKHFQDYVIGVTKDGIYFVCNKLEQMFPENATRTKVLLGSFSAIQLLKENGAISVMDSTEGSILQVPIESIASRFQDPFFSCDTPPPMPSFAPPPLASLYPSLSPSVSRTLAPSSRSIGSASGLLVGANVQTRSTFWHALLHGNENVWQALANAGIKPFLTGLVIGFVDEILGALVPPRYKNQLTYIKNLLKSASALIGTAVLVYMIVKKQTALNSAILTVLLSYVCNVIGGSIGTALAKLLQWVKTNYFTSETNDENGNKDDFPAHVDLFAQSPPAQHYPVSAETVHYCGLEDNGFLHIGLCINCNVQPAVFGFVHSKDNVAHSAFCLPCSALYRKPTCVCCAEVSSTYYFAPATPTCNTRTCLAVALCVTCDEHAVEVPKTATVWRMRKSEETQVTHRTVTLDVRYCSDHSPSSPCDQFRYGKLYSTGYM